MSGEGRSIRHVVIRGRVQRVGFRAWTERTALADGLEGWVRNRSDGSVEAAFAGTSEQVTAMLQACRQGPRKAVVEAVDEREGGPDDLALVRPGERFSVLPTV
jgi:acylphosphatase